MEKVTCIIPAYNEESTIAGVVKTCLETPEIGEVIVVSDGSTDKTVEKVQKIKSKKLKIIALPENHGKGFAVAKGVKMAKNEILLFLDADLINLQPHHLSSLIWPVINNQADMSVGIWGAFSPNTLYSWQLSGQRAFKAKYIKNHLKEIASSKYGLEIVLNEIFKRKKIVTVPLISSKPLHIIKYKKNSPWIREYIKEGLQIGKVFLKNKSKNYQKKFKTELIKIFASYFRTTAKKIRQILEE
ncbi:MAG: glycosyltransferase family 2 protein [Microgenomates group bacterium]